jgi:hypothetical protein
MPMSILNAHVDPQFNVAGLMAEIRLGVSWFHTYMQARRERQAERLRRWEAGEVRTMTAKKTLKLMMIIIIKMVL